MTRPVYRSNKQLITDDFCVLTPAYGRDYKSAHAIKQDFLDGKDFVINPYNAPSTYCSIRDFAPNTIVNLRYKKLTQVCVIHVPAPEPTPNAPSAPFTIGAVLEHKQLNTQEHN